MGRARDGYGGDCKVLGLTRGRYSWGCKRGNLSWDAPFSADPQAPPTPTRTPCPSFPPHPKGICYYFSSSVIGPLGEAYKKLPACARRSHVDLRECDGNRAQGDPVSLGLLPSAKTQGCLTGEENIGAIQGGVFVPHLHNSEP